MITIMTSTMKIMATKDFKDNLKTEVAASVIPYWINTSLANFCSLRSFSGSTTTTWFSRMTFLLTMASMASKSLEFLYKRDGLEVKPTLIFIWQNYPNLKGICSTWDDLLSSGNPAVFHGRRHGGGSLSCYAGACSKCLMYCPSQYKTTYSQLEVFWPCFLFNIKSENMKNQNIFTTCSYFPYSNNPIIAISPPAGTSWWPFSASPPLRPLPSSAHQLKYWSLQNSSSYKEMSDMFNMILPKVSMESLMASSNCSSSSLSLLCWSFSFGTEATCPGFCLNSISCNRNFIILKLTRSGYKSKSNIGDVYPRVSELL